MTREYWVVVHDGTGDGEEGCAVCPYDGNEHEDQGMLVYRSEEAARMSCEHQWAMYDISCRPCRLGEEMSWEEEQEGDER